MRPKPDSLVDGNVWIGSDGADEDGLLLGRQGHVPVLVKGLDEAADKFVRRTDGEGQAARGNLDPIL